MPRRANTTPVASYKPVYESDSDDGMPSYKGSGDFYDGKEESKGFRFGFSEMTRGSGDETRPKSQLTTVKRQLSYRMNSISEKASGLWGTIKTQMAGVSEEDLEKDRKLLVRLNEITNNSFIGVPRKRTISIKEIGSPLGFQIGSADHLRGARVSSITPKGAAAAAGLEIGDVIVAIGTKNVLGLTHKEVIEMVTTVTTFEKHIDLTVAPPLDGPLSSESDAEAPKTPPPKPPSYVVVRNKLVDEFGEESYSRCKRKVQDHLEQLATRFDTLSGIEQPKVKVSTLSQGLNKKFGLVKSSVKGWVGTRLGGTECPTDSDLEKEDRDSLIAARADKEEAMLHDLLNRFLNAVSPLSDYPNAFTEARPGDKGLLGLSYSGVRLYLIEEVSEACFDRNKGYVQGKLQERDLLRLSYGARTVKPAEIGDGSAFGGAEMMVSV